MTLRLQREPRIRKWRGQRDEAEARPERPGTMGGAGAGPWGRSHRGCAGSQVSAPWPRRAGWSSELWGRSHGDCEGILKRRASTLEGFDFPDPGLKREGALELRVSGVVRAGPALGSPGDGTVTLIPVSPFTGCVILDTPRSLSCASVTSAGKRGGGGGRGEELLRVCAHGGSRTSPRLPLLAGDMGDET